MLNHCSNYYFNKESISTPVVEQRFHGELYEELMTRVIMRIMINVLQGRTLYSQRSRLWLIFIDNQLILPVTTL